MSAELRAWWAARSQRERVLLGVLGGLAVAALLLLAVVRPLQDAKGQALAEIRTYQALTGQLRAVGRQGAGPAPRTGPPAELATRTASEAGLAVASAAPDGGGVAVTLADAPYDAVLRWVAETEARTPLRLAVIAIQPGRAPGLVAARAVFR